MSEEFEYDGVLVLDEDDFFLDQSEIVPVPAKNLERPIVPTVCVPKRGKGDGGKKKEDESRKPCRERIPRKGSVKISTPRKPRDQKKQDELLDDDVEPGQKEQEHNPFANEALRIYLREIAKPPLLSAEQELELAKRWDKDGDRSARSKLIVANLRLVVKIAKRHMYRGMPLLDLIEEGNIGLIKAIDRFKPMKGYRVTTYATWWIRQSIDRALADKLRPVRLPVHKEEQVCKVYKATLQFVKEFGHEPSIDDLAEAMGKDPVWIAKIQEDAQAAWSLDMIIHEDGMLLGDTIMDERPNAEEDLMSDRAIPEVENLLALLDPKEQCILRLRFGMTYALTKEDIESVLGISEADMSRIGSRVAEIMQPPEGVLYDRVACSDWLDRVNLGHLNPKELFVFCYRFGRWDGYRATLDEIGRVFGVTRERIRQIEQRAFTTMRAKLEEEWNMTSGGA